MRSTGSPVVDSTVVAKRIFIDAPDGEHVGKPRPPAVDAAFDGAGCAAADDDGFGIREVQSADEDHRPTLLGWQLRQRSAKFAEFDPTGLLGN